MSFLMLAYHSDPKIKSTILKQLRAHAKADEIIKGQYWNEGKGCAVGCTLHSSDHAEYESRFGIPLMLARLEDTIFEGLPNGRAQKWPIEFMAAIKPGADLSLVGWKFQYWLLTDEKVNPGINHLFVRDAVKSCADLLAELANGKTVSSEAVRLALYAAARLVAYSATYSAIGSARSARSAARSAYEAGSAYSASHAADAARLAADSTYSAAVSAMHVAREGAYVMMADKMLRLLNDECLITF
jgi:hypothetical protein